MYWRRYDFGYDDASRLSYANYSEGINSENKYGTHYEYDVMGNITSLTRMGQRDDGDYGLIDDLSLIYEGNHLVSVSDAERENNPTYNNSWNFSDDADEDIEYEYDENGNLTKDLNRKVLSIQYNSLNLHHEYNSLTAR